MSVWWPKISQEIDDFIKRCEFCNCHRAANHNESLKPTPLPERPWQRVGTDILKLDGDYYLVMTDYFSRYLEIEKLSPLTSNTVIGKLKCLFARRGIPDEMVSDKTGQFTSMPRPADKPLPRPADKPKHIKLHARVRTIISQYDRNWLSPFSF